MEAIKRITISEVEEKIKELKEINEILFSNIKVVKEDKSLIGMKNINDKYNEIIIAAGEEKLRKLRDEILEELEENGIIEHEIEPLKK